MEKRKLKDVLFDRIEAKDLTPAKLSTLSGMPAGYLNAILKGEQDKLPPLPYIRQQLVRLAGILELDANELVDSYREEFLSKTSGQSDMLPGNRFALKTKIKAKWWWLAIPVALFLIYTLANSAVFGAPSLNLIMPPANPDPYVTDASTIVLEGIVDPSDKVLINGQSVAVDSEGRFEKEYLLEPELNSIEFVVQKFLGKQLKVVRNVYLQNQVDINL